MIDALIVTGVGMGVVFIVLVALMIVSMAMSRADGSVRINAYLGKLTGRKASPSLESADTGSVPSVGGVATPPPPARLSGPQVAAIALGIALARRGNRSGMPVEAAVPTSSSSWLSEGRGRMMDRPSRVTR